MLVLLLALLAPERGVALAGSLSTSSLLDFVTFDGIDYIRFADEPGRDLTRDDLGIEFATVACSIGEDNRGCSYGLDGGAAFLPAGTRMYAVRGFATEFRLAAVSGGRTCAAMAPDFTTSPRPAGTRGVRPGPLPGRVDDR